jgi:hypothetical protein
MTSETAHLRISPLTFVSRLAAITLLVGLSTGACSSVNGDPTGAGGRGGTDVIPAGGRGGAGGIMEGAGRPGGGRGGAGGSYCGATGGRESPTNACLFDCAPTFSAQAAVSSCSGAGTPTVAAGQCSTGWAWSCKTNDSTYSCIYDKDERLVYATACPNPSQCHVSWDESADGGRACDPSELAPSDGGVGGAGGGAAGTGGAAPGGKGGEGGGSDESRPPTACAGSGPDAGSDCCGSDGKLPPSGAPFGCLTNYSEALVFQCDHVGTCNGLTQTERVGPGFKITCMYQDQTLVFARRCDTDSPFCGASCIDSAKVGDTDAGVDQLCDDQNLPNRCIKV